MSGRWKQSPPRNSERIPSRVGRLASKRDKSVLLPTDRFTGQPLLHKIVERCAELGVQARQLEENLPKRKEIERRIRELDSYTVPHFYEQRGAELDKVAFRYREILRGIGKSEQEISREERRYRKRLTARPRGAPVLKRRLFLEALEEKLAHPRRRWREIAEKLGPDKNDLERGVRRLRALLRREGIEISSPARRRRSR